MSIRLNIGDPDDEWKDTEPRRRIREAIHGRQQQAPVHASYLTWDQISYFRLQDTRGRQRRSTAHDSRTAPPTVLEGLFHISVHLFAPRSPQIVSTGFDCFVLKNSLAPGQPDDSPGRATKLTTFHFHCLSIGGNEEKAKVVLDVVVSRHLQDQEEDVVLFQLRRNQKGSHRSP